MTACGSFCFLDYCHIILHICLCVCVCIGVWNNQNNKSQFFFLFIFKNFSSLGAFIFFNSRSIYFIPRFYTLICICIYTCMFMSICICICIYIYIYIYVYIYIYILVLGRVDLFGNRIAFWEDLVSNLVNRVNNSVITGLIGCNSPMVTS